MAKSKTVRLDMTRRQAERLVRILHTESVAAEGQWRLDAVNIGKKLAKVLGWGWR